jgi:hypothetical protein
VENILTDILAALILGIVFFAGYGWRMHVERRLHNMPWLKKSARQFAAKGPQKLRVIKPLNIEAPDFSGACEVPLQPMSNTEAQMTTPSTPPLATTARKVLSLRRINK